MLDGLKDKFGVAAGYARKAIDFCRERQDAFMTGVVMTGYVGTCAAAGASYGLDRALETGAPSIVTSFYAVAGAAVTAAMAYGGCKVAEWRHGESVITAGIQRSMAIGAAAATLYTANAYFPVV